ncbi:MAG: transketolase family protein [Candidatus Gastranaerophilales bacterium]|nr:transketolase family protein [Candidatus Gastranaerophilales bacterium]
MTEMKTYQSARAEYGKTLVDLGRADKNVVVIDADLSSSTQTKLFKAEFPERHFNVGIAEQDAMTTAAGLSTVGKIPFVSTFAVFASGRAWEQIRNAICYPKFNVKIVATHGGITVGEDGASHQALEDIALMRTIPNMTVIVPADAIQTRKAVEFAVQYKGPVYIRVSRANLPDVFDTSYTFDVMKAIKMTEGSDVSIVTNGETLAESLECAKILKSKGINAEVINAPVVKPLDIETIIKSAQKTHKVVTVENHSIIGGLGGAVCEGLSENYPTKILRIGTMDEFGQSGTSEELMDFYGLTANKLAEKIIGFVK